MATVTVGSLAVLLNARLRNFEAQMVSAQTTLKNFGKSADEAGKKLTGMGKTATAALTLPIAALSAFSIKAAASAEETGAKFGTVFENISDEAEQVANSFKENFGLASSTSKQLLGDTGDLLVGFGFTEKAALDLAIQTNRLAADLASFTNFAGGARGASAALTKALLGERESVKSLGIAILEEDVKKQVAINRTKGFTFETERQEKAFATLIIAQSQSTKAIGDYARTQQSTANRIRRATEALKELNEQWGRFLIDTLKIPEVLARITKAVDNARERFAVLSPEVKKTILVTLGIIAAIGPLLIIFGILTRAVGLFAKLLVFTLNPAVLALGGLVVVLGVKLVNTFGEGDTFGQKLLSTVKKLIEIFNEWKDTAAKTLKLIVIEFEFATKQIFNAFDVTFSNITTVLSDFKDNIVTTLNFIKDNWRTVWEGLGDFTKGVLDDVLEKEKTRARNLADVLKNSALEVKDTVKGAEIDIAEIARPGFFKDPLAIGRAGRVFAKSLDPLTKLKEIDASKFVDQLRKVDISKFRIVDFLQSPLKGLVEGIKRQKPGVTVGAAISAGLEKVEIDPPKFKKSELRNVLTESLEIEEKRLKAVAQALADPIKLTIGDIASSAVANLGAAAQTLAKEAIPGAEEAKFVTTTAKFAAAAEKGTVEAFKAEIGQQKIISKVEKNTKEEAKNTKLLVDEQRKTNSLLGVGMQQIEVLAIP